MQNSGLRDIAHIADTFSTKGLDKEQIDLINRIRSIAHDCLRDQVGGPAIVSVAPEIELGKRVRGKERVRRKGTGKRLRKDDAAQYNTASEDDHSQFCGATVEVDQLNFHNDREENQTQLCPVESDINPIQMIHADGEADNLQLCNPDIEMDHPALNHAAGIVGETEVSHAASVVDERQILNAMGKNDDSQICSEDKQLSDVTKEVVDSQHHDEPKEVIESQLCNAPDEVVDSQLDARKEVDCQQSDVSKTVDSQLVVDTTEEVIGSQLSDAVTKVDDTESQLSHAPSENEPETTKQAAEFVPQSSVETTGDIIQQNAVAL